MEQLGKKRKRPPTFQHFPEKRARKLKKAWVGNAKIKSKWKAQKRREGLGTKRPTDDDEVKNENSDDVESSQDPEISENNSAHEDQPQIKSTTEKDHRRAQPRQDNKSSMEATSRSSDKRPSKPQSASDNLGPTAESDTTRPSLREMAQQAYSAKSLHTYKSDPLHRRGGQTTRGRGRGTDQRGRGQPNMKLRMNVMLEVIKRDFAS